MDPTLRNYIRKEGKGAVLKALFEGLSPWEIAKLLWENVEGHFYLLLALARHEGHKQQDEAHVSWSTFREPRQSSSTGPNEWMYGMDWTVVLPPPPEPKFTNLLEFDYEGD